MQVQKETVKNKTRDLSDVKAKFNELKSKEVEKTKTKIINLRLQVGCGCGESFDYIYAVVPEDYTGFSNNDYVDTDDVSRLKRLGYDVYWKAFNGAPENHDPKRYDKL